MASALTGILRSLVVGKPLPVRVRSGAVAVAVVTTMAMGIDLAPRRQPEARRQVRQLTPGLRQLVALVVLMVVNALPIVKGARFKKVLIRGRHYQQHRDKRVPGIVGEVNGHIEALVMAVASKQDMVNAQVQGELTELRQRQNNTEKAHAQMREATVPIKDYGSMLE
ncbi:unnamed protein product [Prorocentrum cordatum]|uniref:Uncharacterized protein n=1 Tax=Prorocentrum cordatum TaxID=2364126 RepID=A0ABN9VXD8_9DINO|nr:unnamed protein product [Polarella glacialis]